MNVVKVVSSSNEYHVYVGENIRHELKKLLPKNYTSILIVTDDVVAQHYLDDVKKSLSEKHVFSTVIPSGEKVKNINTFYQLHTAAINAGLDRQSLIIALGGGVVGDIAGFVAATYMRGIDFIQMPTTILAHDSSVGSKVAINHEQGKNLIGNFHSPSAVVYDVQTLHTLNHQEIRSGYAELIKEALIADIEFVDQVLATDLSVLTNEILTDHLNKGIEIKAAIVIADEKEMGIRKHLNLGHTLGHALETVLEYGTLKHGEAVAIGLLFALRVSEKIFSVQLPFEQLYSWLKTNGFPLQLPKMNPEHILSKMKQDKKAVKSNVQMILLRGIAQPAVIEINDKSLCLYLKSFIEELKNREN